MLSWEVEALGLGIKETWPVVCRTGAPVGGKFPQLGLWLLALRKCAVARTGMVDEWLQRLVLELSKGSYWLP